MITSKRTWTIILSILEVIIIAYFVWTLLQRQNMEEKGHNYQEKLKENHEYLGE